MKMNKSYFLVVLFLCGLSVGNGFAAAPSTWALLPGAGAAAAATAPVPGYLGWELINAVRAGKETEVERLIAARADVNDAIQPYRWTALIHASQDGHENIVEMLLQARADVNAQDHSGYTALMLAAREGHENIVEKLLQEGAEVNAVDLGGFTALMYAAMYGRENIVEILLQAGADVNAVNQSGISTSVRIVDKPIILWVVSGSTALIMAATYGHENTVEKLLQVDEINVNARNENGKTAYDLARTQEIKNIIERARLLQVEKALEIVQPNFPPDMMHEIMGCVQTAEFPERK